MGFEHDPAPRSGYRGSEPQMWERYGLLAWIAAAKRRMHPNVLAVALANKLARIAWAVLANGRNFEMTRKSNAAPQPA